MSNSGQFLSKTHRASNSSRASAALHTLDKAGHMSGKNTKFPALSNSASAPCPTAYQFIIIAFTLFIFEFFCILNFFLSAL